MVRIKFESFKSLSNCLNLHSNVSDLVRRVKICIRMLKIWFEWSLFAFECFKSLSNFQIYIRMLLILSNGSNLHSNASNAFRKIRIYIQMFQIPFEWLEFTFESFKSLSNFLNLHSNASNPFRIIIICIRILHIPFELFEFAFECFESRSKD